MSMVAEERKVDEKPWTMPVPELGGKVVWLEDGFESGKRFSGTVVEISVNTLTLRVDTYSGQVLKTSVRYARDPRLNDENRQANGAWIEAIEDRRLDNLIADMEQLKRDMTGLKATIASKIKG